MRPVAPNPNRLLVTLAEKVSVASSSRVAAKYGGRVNKHLRTPLANIEVVEFASSADASAYKASALGEAWAKNVEVDQPRYVDQPYEYYYHAPTYYYDATSPNAEMTPWGISRVYGETMPNASSFPSVVTHPLCIIDSGYDISHPDLPDDATAADPAQSDPNASMYFGGDLCNHGTHVAGTIAAIGGNNEGVVGVYPGAPNLKIVKTFGEDGLVDDPTTPYENEACGFTYASEVVSAVQHCVDSGAKIVSSESRC